MISRRTQRQHFHDLVQLLGKHLLVSDKKLLSAYNFIELEVGRLGGTSSSGASTSHSTLLTRLAVSKVESTRSLKSSERRTKPLLRFLELSRK